MASMKLRVRASTGGPTIRLQIPLLCSLQGAKDALGHLISLPPSSFSLSLNKKDEIHGPAAALLSSFGVTSGDLLYYIVNQGSASLEEIAGRQTAVEVIPETSNRVSRERNPRGEGRASTSIESEANPPTSTRAGGRAVSTPNTRRELCAAAAVRRANLAVDPHPVLVADPIPAVAVAGSSSQMVASVAEGVRNDPVQVPMEVEPDRRGSGHSSVPIPDLLQRVLSSEIGNVRQASAYLVLAIHAVMLETGFVRVDTSGDRRPAPEGYKLPSGWSAVGLVNLVYTLPDFTRPAESSVGRELGEEALLRCQIVGNAVVVYGAVTGGGVYRLSLSVLKFLRDNVHIPKVSGDHSKEDNSPVQSPEEDIAIEGVASHSGQAHANYRVGSNVEDVHVFRDIFELWKEVKDCLSLPLMTVMCERAGLPPPPSLLRLPTELKIKVLDSLPSIALANLSCVCSELRFLAASEDLWKQRYKAEFGANVEKPPGGRSWKCAFVREFNHRRRREEERREAERRFRAEVFPPGIILRPPSFSPNFGGLDYFQGLGGPSRHAFGGFDVGGGAFRNFAFSGGPSGNPTVFPHNWATGCRLDGDLRPHGHEDGLLCFPDFDPNGNGVRNGPPMNSAMARETRSMDRLNGGGGFGLGPGVDYQQRLG